MYPSETVLRQADEIPIAPSVGIHMPPRHSLAEELGLGLDGATHVDGDYDDIDLRIQGEFLTFGVDRPLKVSRAFCQIHI